MFCNSDSNVGLLTHGIMVVADTDSKKWSFLEASLKKINRPTDAHLTFLDKPVASEASEESFWASIHNSDPIVQGHVGHLRPPYK